MIESCLLAMVLSAALPPIELTEQDAASARPVRAARLAVWGLKLGDHRKDAAVRCGKACQWVPGDRSLRREGVVYRFDEQERLFEIRLPMAFRDETVGETRRWFSESFANDAGERADALGRETQVKIKSTSVLGRNFGEVHTFVFGDTGLELSARTTDSTRFEPQFLILRRGGSTAP